MDRERECPALACMEHLGPKKWNGSDRQVLFYTQSTYQSLNKFLRKEVISNKDTSPLSYMQLDHTGKGASLSYLSVIHLSLHLPLLLKLLP